MGKTWNAVVRLRRYSRQTHLQWRVLAVLFAIGFIGTARAVEPSLAPPRLAPPRVAAPEDIPALHERAAKLRDLYAAAEADVAAEARSGSQATPPKTMQDALALVLAARQYTCDAQYDRAIALYEKVLIFAEPYDPRPSEPVVGSATLQAEARWGIAQVRRAQGRWEEALRLYRLDRMLSPRGDGCVSTGAGVQEMALVEGACLENLGHFSEAVHLYWPAAMHLSPSIAPVAMRRLFDLYAASRQSAVLEAAVAREVTAYHSRSQWLQDAASSASAVFERVRWARQAARGRHWDVLLRALQFDPWASYTGAGSYDRAVWERREAISALALVREEAVPLLERALRRDGANPYLRNALLFCRQTDQRHRDQTSLVEDVESFGDNGVPLQFGKLPTTVRLPSQFPSMFTQP